MINEDIIMSQKPYLIRAMYEWMLDFGYTPRLVLCPAVNSVVVPEYLSNQTQITLDISPQAITNLMLGNDNITFEAYFDGVPHEIVLPMNCIGAIIAKEKEVGYIFDIEDFIPQSTSTALKESFNPEKERQVDYAYSTGRNKNSRLTRRKHSRQREVESSRSLGKGYKKSMQARSVDKRHKTSTASSRHKRSYLTDKKRPKKTISFLSSLRQKISV